MQFQRLIYGGVVDEIREAGELFNNILVLKPKNKEVEDKIGNLTFKSSNKKNDCSLSECTYIYVIICCNRTGDLSFSPSFSTGIGSIPSLLQPSKR
ncbi:hypothetical protein ACFLX6_03090 [Chloroflexota bacterium]